MTRRPAVSDLTATPAAVQPSDPSSCQPGSRASIAGRGGPGRVQAAGIVAERPDAILAIGAIALPELYAISGGSWCSAMSAPREGDLVALPHGRDRG